jgi:hypothetical protein
LEKLGGFRTKFPATSFGVRFAEFAIFLGALDPVPLAVLLASVFCGASR